MAAMKKISGLWRLTGLWSSQGFVDSLWLVKLLAGKCRNEHAISKSARSTSQRVHQAASPRIPDPSAKDESAFPASVAVDIALWTDLAANARRPHRPMTTARKFDRSVRRSDYSRLQSDWLQNPAANALP